MSRIVVVVVAAAVFAASGCSGDPEVEAPTLSLNVDSEVTYTAGEDEVHIELQATDPQDLDLEIELVTGPEQAGFNTYRNQAVFKWTPHHGDITEGEPHQLVFAVTNEQGATTERTVHVHIVGADGPYFVNSSSQLYDPSSDEPLQFEVQVQHDELPEVDLSMPQGPEGASFQQLDELAGQFHWQPSLQQRDQRTHRAVFEADDGEQTARQEVTIIFQAVDTGEMPAADPDAEICEGEPPIEHHPVMVGEGIEDYQVEGQIQRTDRDWQEAVLYWSWDDPLSEDPAFEAEPLQLDGNSFSGEIPNPLLDSGETVDISYSICVFDGTEDDEGAICAPEEFFYRFTAYSYTDEGCRGDGDEIGSADQAADISTSHWEPFRSCADTPNYHRLEVGDDEIVELALSYSAQIKPHIEVRLDGEPVDVEHLRCIGLDYALVDEPGTLEVRVAQQHFPYHLTAFVEEDNGGACPIEADSPDDAEVVEDGLLFAQDRQLCSEDDIDVYAIEALPGDIVGALFEYDDSEAAVSTTLYAPSQVDDVVQGGEGVAQVDGSGGDGYIEHVAEETGQYYMSVSTPGPSANYDLFAERLCGIDDQFAGNHSLDDAELVDTGSWEELKLCAGSSDWYAHIYDGFGDAWIESRVWVQEGDDFAATITAYNEDGEPIVGGQDQGQTDQESLVEVSDGEMIYLEVQSSSDVIYELEIEESGFM